MAKSVQGLKGLLKINKRDRQVFPSEEIVSEDKKQDDTKKNAEEKRLEREQKRQKKEEAQRIKDIETQGRIEKRSGGLRKAVKQDLAKTTCETFVTFCFIVTVGTFLFGGGTALIVSGRENNILDFIVVGSSGIVIGIIFTTAGITLIFKPIYENYQKRKKELKSSSNAQPPGPFDMPFYFDDVQRTILTNQLRDEGRSSRRPSNVELYGDTPSGQPSAGEHEVSVQDPRHNQEPPDLAVPNIVETTLKNKNQQDPVFFLNTREDIQLQATGDEAIIGYLGNPENPSQNRHDTVQSLTVPGLDQEISHLSVTIDKTEERELLQSYSVDHGRSESPVVVVTSPKDNINTEKNRKDSISKQNLHGEQKDPKSKPTIIINELLSREHSDSTVRSSKVQTPSSVILTYDKDTFHEGAEV